MIKQITSALKITPFVFIVAIVFLFGLSYTYAAFMDNTSIPPTNNAPAPLNIGFNSQYKNGNLGANGLVTKILSVNGAIDFNGVTRTSWPSGGGGLTGPTGPRGPSGTGTNHAWVTVQVCGNASYSHCPTGWTLYSTTNTDAECTISWRGLRRYKHDQSCYKNF